MFGFPSSLMFASPKTSPCFDNAPGLCQIRGPMACGAASAEVLRGADACGPPQTREFMLTFFSCGNGDFHVIFIDLKGMSCEIVRYSSNIMVFGFVRKPEVPEDDAVWGWGL